MSPNDPIRRVSIVSTGHVQIRPDHVSSTWRPMFLWLLTSRQWTGPRPINAYVIEHRDGVVLFDTGQEKVAKRSERYVSRRTSVGCDSATSAQTSVQRTQGGPSDWGQRIGADP